METGYMAIIQKDESGRYLVRFPDFGWGGTDGATLEEAVEEAADCLCELIAATLCNGEALPPHRKV